MRTVAQVTRAMQYVLVDVATEAGKKRGFIQRERKLNGASFVQAMVFGWLSNGEASLSELNQAAASVGVRISAQGLDKRFTSQAAECLKQVLEAATHEVVRAEPMSLALINRFASVRLMDSSTVGLPESLAELWTGCGGHHGATAALKIQVDLNFTSGALEAVWMQAGKEHDQCKRAQQIDLSAGSLRIADLGYFKLDVLEKYAAQEAFWLTRLKIGTVMYDLNGQQIVLEDWLNAQSQTQVEQPVLLGQTHRIRGRLLAARVPDRVAEQRRRKMKREAQERGQTLSHARLALASWTLLVTNVPDHLLTLAEALILYRVRWQIELLFKLWKSIGKLDASLSHNPWRILCEVYAKLLALMIQHWVFLVGFWAYPNRSLTKAAQTIQRYALSLALVCRTKRRLSDLLLTIDRCLAAGCRINPRRSHPNTYQLLLSCPDFP
jgi:hypothetical protein